MASTFKNAVASNVGLTPTDIYTVPAATATTVIGLSLANVAASGLVYVTVTMTKNGGSPVVYLVKTAPVPQGGALVLFGGDQKLVMMTGDKITVTSSAATSIDVALSYLEIA